MAALNSGWTGIDTGFRDGKSRATAKTTSPTTGTTPAQTQRREYPFLFSIHAAAKIGPSQMQANAKNKGPTSIGFGSFVAADGVWSIWHARRRRTLTDREPEMRRARGARDAVWSAWPSVTNFGGCAKKKLPAVWSSASASTSHGDNCKPIAAPA
jgi:hypothetical protein